jgi:molecular chaperone GrpE
MMLRKIEKDIVSLIKDKALLKEDLEKQDKIHHAHVKSLLLSILEVLDDFDRRFNNIGAKLQDADEQTKIWINYFRSTKKLLGIVVREQGVAEIETIGMKAISGFHYIVDVVERKDMEDETIVEELRKGYLWKNEVLRKAEVISVKNK